MSPATLSLILAAAVIHASWNILLKRVQGGLSFLWCVDILQSLVFAPWVAWVIWHDKAAPTFAGWFFILGSAVIHIGYYFFLQRGYRLGDISLVYPIARGSGPMISSLAAILFLGERPGVSGVLGISAICTGIFFLTGGTRRTRNPQTSAAVLAGLLTGTSIAGYTIWDKYAVSVVQVSPVLLDLLGNPIQAMLLTPLVWRQRRHIQKYWAGKRLELFGVTILNPISYILVLTALTSAPVSQIAPTREVSTLIGALVGGRLFAEQDLQRRLLAASVIVVGVIAIAHG
jgi:drug/metabolite transporter (DMT)-like permease